MLLKTYFV